MTCKPGLSLVVLFVACDVLGQSSARPTPPTRDPHTEGYVSARELPDGTNAPPDVDGNFILGPMHVPAAEMLPFGDMPKGTISTFMMQSTDSKIYPGIARDPGTMGTADPKALASG